MCVHNWERSGADHPDVGVAGSLHPQSQREAGVLRQHSRTVAAATMAAEEARRAEPAASPVTTPNIPAVPTVLPQVDGALEAMLSWKSGK